MAFKKPFEIPQEVKKNLMLILISTNLYWGALGVLRIEKRHKRSPIMEKVVIVGIIPPTCFKYHNSY